MADSEVCRRWEYHRLQLPEARNAWGDLEKQTPEQLISKSQDYVSRLFQVALERGPARERAQAASSASAIDFWPSVTMAAIDFYRVPTKVVDTVGRSFAPVAALFDYDRDEWKTGEAGEGGVVGCQRYTPRLPRRPRELAHREHFGAGVLRARHRGGLFRKSRRCHLAGWRGEPAIASVSAGGQQLSENVFEFAVK